MNKNKSTKIRQPPVIRNTQMSKAQKRSSKAVDQPWSKLIDTLTNCSRQTVFAVVLIVVLLMLNFILRFPDLGAIIAEYNQF